MQDTDIVRCEHCQMLEQATEGLTAEQERDFHQYLLGALVDLADGEALRKSLAAARNCLDEPTRK